jgi:DNA/RNA endonuclease YhcR with UshA esterase domain
MKPLLLAFVLFYFSASNAQTEIKLQELKDYIGDNVKVQGIISGVTGRSASATKEATLIYVGEKYPKQALTIIISPGAGSKLHITPSTSDIGNFVWVSGKLEKYKGRATIRITDPRQLEVVQDMQGEPE